MPAPFPSLRLRKHADYLLVYGASRKHGSTTLSFFYRDRAGVAERSPGTGARFGITVPRVLGPAVLRNRIKRRVRVVAREALHLLPAGVDVVLHPRPEIASIPFQALASEMQAVFSTVARRIASGTVNTPLPRTPRRIQKSGKGNKKTTPVKSVLP